mgnify:CR=1 FL=1
MAINVKRLKRVIQGDEPLKVLNSGDKKPAFRQNGYGLTFDSANSDYLVNDRKELVNDGDYLYIKGKTPFQPASSPFITFDNGGTSDQLRLLTNGDIRFVHNGSLGAFQGLLVDENFDMRFEVLSNGTQFKMTTPNGSVIRTKNSPLPFYVGDFFSGGGIFTDFELERFEINGETFNLTESRGTTTTGSLGTIATINTSNAGGVQYLDSTMWNKKSFALIGEPLDDEKVTILGVEYPLSATPITEIEHLGEMFSLKEGLGNQVYGDGGTIGIISTDNVLGIERINFGMWLKGDDTNGWNPYT